MNRSSTAGATRFPGVCHVLAVLAVAAMVLLPSAGLAATVGDAGAADPTGVWPLEPVPAVLRGFDPPTSPWSAGHRGVDLAGTVGQQVHAALAGTVAFAGSLAGRGVVVVDHGATRTTYEPVDPVVAVGDTVAAGAVLGTLTLIQSHCLPGACLHWGWIRNAGDVYRDPLRLLGLGAPVRLLPLWRDAPVSPRSQGVLVPTMSPLPYAAWRPPVRIAGSQARGCACW
jgi:murein DD-endopeptidase MepM/ murein hydrolase activator NlpD